MSKTRRKDVDKLSKGRERLNKKPRKDNRKRDYLDIEDRAMTPEVEAERWGWGEEDLEKDA